MPCGEGVAAAGLKVAFKGLCLFKSFECDVGFDFPWEKLGGMRNLPCVVFCEAGAEGTILRPSVSGCLADGSPSIARRAKDGGGGTLKTNLLRIEECRPYFR